ncbi:MAG: hypothetical protein QW040_00500 [Candidatus Aenigmatarchaeota archaeon]
MSFLQIKIEVDIIYKPIYNPLKSQALSIAIAQSDMSEKILDYLEGKIDKAEIESEINKVLPSYKITVADKILGNPKLVSEEKTSLELVEDNKKIKIEVMV